MPTVPNARYSARVIWTTAPRPRPRHKSVLNDNTGRLQAEPLHLYFVISSGNVLYRIAPSDPSPTPSLPIRPAPTVTYRYIAFLRVESTQGPHTALSRGGPSAHLGTNPRMANHISRGNMMSLSPSRSSRCTTSITDLTHARRAGEHSRCHWACRIQYRSLKARHWAASDSCTSPASLSSGKFVRGAASTTGGATTPRRDGCSGRKRSCRLW
jgi:hypothetical protein